MPVLRNCYVIKSLTLLCLSERHRVTLDEFHVLMQRFPRVIRPSAVAGRVVQNRVCPYFCPLFRPSFRPSFPLSRCFLRIASLIFSKFWHGARIPCEVVRDSWIFWEKFFLPPKLEKWGQNESKTGFFPYMLRLNLMNYFAPVRYNNSCCTGAVSDNDIINGEL